MKPQRLNRIAELRLRRKMNQSELAQAVGAHKITISKLERGDMRLTQQWMERLATALSVSPSEILADSSLVRTVYISGSLRQNIDVMDLEVNDSLNQMQSVDFQIDYGVKSNHLSIFFSVETEAFSPAIREGDIVRFSTVEESGLFDLYIIGRVCIVEIDEPHSMLVGVLERGSESDTYDIRHPAGAFRRGVRPDRIYVLNLVLGLPDVQVREDGVPS